MDLNRFVHCDPHPGNLMVRPKPSAYSGAAGGGVEKPVTATLTTTPAAAAAAAAEVVPKRNSIPHQVSNILYHRILRSCLSHSCNHGA